MTQYLTREFTGPVIGCNFMYQHRALDHLCVFDTQMLDQIDQDHQNLLDCRLWSAMSRHAPGFEELCWPLAEQPHNSGMMAVRLAIHLGFKDVLIWGCDWGLSDESIFDYGVRNSTLKYTNSQRRLMRLLAERVRIRCVHDHKIDVPVEVITADRIS